MKLSRVLPVLLLSVLAVPIMMGGCLGANARNSVVPAAVLAIDGVEQDARAGLETLAEPQKADMTAALDAFVAAVKTKDRVKISTDAWPRWGAVRTLASRGIQADLDAGKIGPGVATSLRERLNTYEAALQRLVQLQ